MATFLELRNRVSDEVIDLPAAVTARVGEFVNDALKWAQNRYNFEVMEEEEDYVTVEGQRLMDPAALPADFKAFRLAPQEIPRLNRPRKIFWAPDRLEAERALGSDPDLDFGEPRVLLPAKMGLTGARNLEVYPFPDGNSDYDDGEYRVRIYYWKFLPELSADGDTNWLTVNGKEFIVARAASRAFRMNHNEEMETRFLATAQAEYLEVVRQDKLLKASRTETFKAYPGGRSIRIAS
jgi:hypothetical protein